MAEKGSFDEQNLVNLIKFFERELKMVLDGKSAEEVFTSPERRRLRNRGVLGYKFPDWFVSEKTKGILKIAEES